MNRYLGYCWLLGALLVWGCQSPPRLVVYADPWLGGFAEKVCADFQDKNPEVQVELKQRSSEFVAQNLYFGQPMDVFLCFRPAIVHEKGLAGSIASEVALGNMQLVLAEVRSEYVQVGLGGDSCLVMAASDRPLRTYAEEWEPRSALACRVYGDFYRQVRDYLLRGWVRQGIVPDLLVRQNPDRLMVKEEGPTFPGAFVAFRLRHAPNPKQADKFSDYLRSEKSYSLLAGESFIP